MPRTDFTNPPAQESRANRAGVPFTDCYPVGAQNRCVSLRSVHDGSPQGRATTEVAIGRGSRAGGDLRNGCRSKRLMAEVGTVTVQVLSGRFVSL